MRQSNCCQSPFKHPFTINPIKNPPTPTLIFKIKIVDVHSIRFGNDVVVDVGSDVCSDVFCRIRKRVSENQVLDAGWRYVDNLKWYNLELLFWYFVMLLFKINIKTLKCLNLHLVTVNLSLDYPFLCLAECVLWCLWLCGKCVCGCWCRLRMVKACVNK